MSSVLFWQAKYHRIGPIFTLILMSTLCASLYMHFAHRFTVCCNISRAHGDHITYQATRYNIINQSTYLKIYIELGRVSPLHPYGKFFYVSAYLVSEMLS